MRRAGLRRGVSYLVRPDGYLALVDRESRASTLTRYLAERLAGVDAPRRPRAGLPDRVQ
jgi:hypothetical protein